MTGYGRAEGVIGEENVTIELTSVNRRQADIVLHLPNRLTEIETALRKQVAAQVSRGRVTASVKFEPLGRAEGRLRVDEGLAREYLAALKRIAAETGEPLNLNAADLLRAPGIFTVEDAPSEPDSLLQPLSELLDTALQAWIAMQETEGSHLRTDMEGRLATLAAEADAIRELAPQVAVNYRKNLFKRLQDSGLDINLDDDRVLKEIGIFADRSDVSEELTRIDSHLKQFHAYLRQGEAVGRPLDFLCQELNREFNTIGSKANDSGIAQRVVNAKTELEKVREQVQNIQ